MSRDKFLVGMTLYILFVFVVMRVVIPEITAGVASKWDFDLIPYHALIVSYFVVQVAPLLPGIVGGFQLLECREEGMAKALLVSPSSLAVYLSVTCLAMFAAAFVLTLATEAIIGMELRSWSTLIVVALVAAPVGPIFALLIASVADNKVQADSAQINRGRFARINRSAG